MATSMSNEQILELIDKNKGKRGSIIAILEDIQASYNYLPKETLQTVAAETGHSLVDLYGIATFYTSFSLEPRGEHLASVCMGTACHQPIVSCAIFASTQEVVRDYAAGKPQGAELWRRCPTVNPLTRSCSVVAWCGGALRPHGWLVGCCGLAGHQLGCQSVKQGQNGAAVLFYYSPIDLAPSIFQ